MKTHIIEISTKARSDFVDITYKIEKIIPPAMNGICHVFCKHTTAGLTINENADPSVRSDIINMLDKIVPWNSPLYNHLEGNSAAHIKASMMGFSVTIPVSDGRLVLGTWQAVYFCEFDGPRRRNVFVSFIT